MPPRPRGPVLAQEDRDKVLSMTDELTDLCATHARFSDVSRREITTASADLSRYRFKSLEGVGLSTKDSRRFFLDDLRRVAKKGLPDVAFLLELFDHLPANTHLEQPGETVRFTEIDIPRVLLSLAPAPSDIRGVPRPDQSMCNWIQMEIANGVAKLPLTIRNLFRN